MIQPPIRIIVSKDKKSITVEFSETHAHEFSAEILRVLSPSAEVQGHSPSQRKLVDKKQNISINDIQPIGNYAIRIIFDDQHSSGLYSWEFLNNLAENYQAQYDNYLNELKQNNLTRL